MSLSLIYSVLFLGILSVSTASIMIRYCTAPSLVIAFYRVLLTAGLAGLIGLKDRRNGFLSISRNDIAYCLGAGFFLALHFGFWITSLDYTSVSSSVLFTNLQVIFVLAFSFLFLRERVGFKAILGIIVALMGSVLIAGGDWHGGRLFGDLLALISAVFVAGYFIIGRRVRARVDVWTYSLIVNGTAALVLLAAVSIAGFPLYPYPKSDYLLFFGLALVPGIAGHTVLNWALKFVKAPIVAVSVLGESVMASILAFIFFHEALRAYQLLGGFLILAGIYTAYLNQSQDFNSTDLQCAPVPSPKNEHV
ncbi:DMT family transporter [Syntrophothermus lipocalidus]|uniref:EamA domain-containing protein n=1 Tax=Syntrophothermus lipocalidus (strain DSM 12680 / TGB-C1) TaxID=643648 RepID=D7CL70_SYNLT|nr:DMT family transporter [Syntrophothermus lipocalidus]ADI01455.1 protein of unknown function DUF6 transmembrane [Syntrophothermus lipocalidus DSM 12680]